MLTNTFADLEVNDDQTVFTRLDPAGRGASQIDFIAASRSLPAVSVGVDTDVFFKTDHRPILATFALRARAAVKRKGCPLNWPPNDAWVGARAERRTDRKSARPVLRMRSGRLGVITRAKCVYIYTYIAIAVGVWFMCPCNSVCG